MGQLDCSSFLLDAQRNIIISEATAHSEQDFGAHEWVENTSVHKYSLPSEYLPIVPISVAAFLSFTLMTGK